MDKLKNLHFDKVTSNFMKIKSNKTLIMQTILKIYEIKYMTNRNTKTLNNLTLDSSKSKTNMVLSLIKVWKQKCFGFDGTQQKFGISTSLSKHGV